MEQEPIRRVDPAGEVRVAARRQAEAISRHMVTFAALAVVVIIMCALIALDYLFVQETHRVVKVLLGVIALGAILAMPRFGLVLLPIVTPFLPWVPPTPIPGLNPLNVLLFSIFGTFALGRILARQDVFRPTRMGRILGLLLLLCLVSIFRGAAVPTGYMYDARATGLQLFRAATTFAPYFIYLAMLRDRKERQRVAWALLAGLLLEGLVTLKLGRNGSGQRATGTIGQSNELGAYLAIFTVMGAAMLAGTRNWFAKLGIVAIAGLGVVGVMLSVSRGSMLALIAGLIVVAWRSSKWVVGLLVLALALGPIWLPDYVMDRIKSSSVQVEGSDEATVDMAAEARLETWRTILTVVQDHPLDGVGFAGLAYVLPDVGSELGLEEVKDSAHNTFLRMLSEMGALGLALFIWLLWKAWRLGDDGVRRARDAFDRSLAVGLCGAVVTMAVSCAFGDRFFNVIISSGFWILLALVDHQVQSEPAAEPALAVVPRARRFGRARA
jgi:O-antigen ligase